MSSNGISTMPTQEAKVDGGGLRYNQGKLRYDLLHPYAEQKLAEVFTRGAQKYAPRNWERGMSWTSVLASLKRHLAEIEKGNDFDEETGLLHAAQVMWNAHALTAYYKIYPQGDDRPHTYLQTKRIGLDIDEVLADFVGAAIAREGVTERPIFWNCPILAKVLKEVKGDADFWGKLPVRTKASDLGFEPTCYITKRLCNEDVTRAWLLANGFPQRPIISLKPEESKLEAVKAQKVDIFVDDNFDTFSELNRNGILCYLFDAPHNRKYNVGHKRIYSLKELA